MSNIRAHGKHPHDFVAFGFRPRQETARPLLHRSYFDAHAVACQSDRWFAVED
jgi:hypothetical protein